MNFFSLLINTCFYVGKIPIAPGTMGSIVALILWFFLQPSVYIMILLLIVLIPLSFYTISVELNNTEAKDPQYIVVDEVVGMWITLMFISTNNILHIFLAFILFRMLDIIKPSIIYRVQFIPGAWGILLDDIIAGLLSGFIILGISII